MKAEVKTIGPAEARALLANNTHNRNLSPRTVARYAKEMQAGRWRLNGIGISLYGKNGDARVVNGQHRLQAVIDSDTTQRFLIVWEEDPEVYRTFDVGTNRNLATFISMDGLPQPVVIGALSRIVLLYEQYPDRVWESGLVNGAEVYAWYKEQDVPKLIRAVHDFNNARSRLKRVGTWYAGFSWLIRNRSPKGEVFDEFTQPVEYGNDLSVGDPRLALRNYMIRGGTTLRTDDWKRQAMTGVALRAWNDWLAGNERNNYKFQAGTVRNGKRIQSSLPMPEIL